MADEPDPRTTRAEDPEGAQKGKLDELHRSLEAMSKPGATAGITFGITIVSMSLLGYWLDTRFDTSPWFMIGGLGLGGVSGFIHLVETVSPGTLFPKRKPKL